MGIKTKLLMAYESESSLTIRLTPDDLGKAVNDIDVSRLPSFFDALVAEEFCMTDERRKVLAVGLARCASKLVFCRGSSVLDRVRNVLIILRMLYNIANK